MAVRRFGEQCGSELRRRAYNVLARIKYEQQVSCSKVATQRSHQRLGNLFADAEGVCNAIGHEVGVGDRSELDQPDAVSILLDQLGSDAQRDARLADSAHTDQGHEAISR